MRSNGPKDIRQVEQSGAVIGIFIRPAAGKATVQVEQVRAVSGLGLEGDYFFNQNHHSRGEPGRSSIPDREVTLIEIEALQAAASEHGVRLDLGESRRNLVTQGVSLNDLVGVQFRIGEALMEGIRLCEPCSHLANLTQKKVMPALVHRGGLRACILASGAIRVGDPIFILDQRGGQGGLHQDFEEKIDG